MALSLDRKAFIDILTEGQGDIGGAMLPPPEGVWGMPPEMLKTLPGYDPDVEKNRARSPRDHGKARLRAGQAAGGQRCRPATSRLRDPAVILIDQLKEIYIDGELDPIDTAHWFPKDHAQGLHGRPQAHRKRGRRPRPAILRELRLRRRSATTPATATRSSTSCSISNRWNPTTRSARSWSGRSKGKLAEDGARPIIFHTAHASCRQPQVKGLTIMVNSIYNGWRFEDAGSTDKPATKTIRPRLCGCFPRSLYKCSPGSPRARAMLACKATGPSCMRAPINGPARMQRRGL